MLKNSLLIDLPMDYETALATISLKLAAEGIFSEPTFEIDSACTSFAIAICPHTGESPCPCKLAVLKVYQNPDSLLAVIVHSHENKTEFWEEDMNILKNPLLAQRIRELLKEEADLLLGRN
jgi:hypothetical protein